MREGMRLLLAYKVHAGGEKDPFTSLLPVGLGYLNAVMLQHGHQSRLANFSASSWKQIESILRHERVDILGVSQFTHNRFESIRLAALAKRINPACLVVFGGPHASACYREVLASGAVDAVVLGEGEQTLPDLVKHVTTRGREALSEVPGIAFRRREEVICTAPRLPLLTLDDLPFPATAFADSFGVDLRRQLEFIITSRGCPSSCSFCGSPRFWGKALRFRSPRSIVDEIKQLKERFGLIYFSIRDDTFTSNRERTLEFCRLLIGEELFILWNCQSRVSAVDEEMLFWMKRAGCECIQFGVESGSPAILKRLGKRITPDEIRRAAQGTRRAGLNLSVYLITGVPGETEDDLSATLALIDDIKPMDGQVSPLAYFPGTLLFEQGVASGDVSADLFLRKEGQAFFVRNDPFVSRATDRLLVELGKVAAAYGFTERDFRAQKKLLGYCHATNLAAGELFEELGELGKAEQEYREITERESRNPWGWLALGELFGRSGAHRKSREAFEQVLQLVPNHIPAYEALAELSQLAGNAGEAAHYKRLVRGLTRPGGNDEAGQG